jgi:putative ABC transport system permease protein
MYVTLEQSPQYGLSVVIRGATDPGLLREAARKAVHEINADQALPGMKTLEAIKDDSLTASRIRATLLGIFAGVSLLLAAIGIYGVISYSITQRTREIGVRTALGATRGDILRLILGHGLRLAGMGLVVGVAGALGLTRVLSSMLFGVSRYDVPTMTAVGVVLALVVLLACLVPARRATKVDPLVALRCE